ncbi:MAG: VWA domain-containing protein, partial [Calditrichaeota bacterium]|nr:VWA domain-containing protein [Calditrichota bacterium]
QLAEFLRPDTNQSNKRNLAQKEIVNERLKTGDADWMVEGMQSLSEFPFLVKKQFLLPSKIFDRKLIAKDLLVKKTSAKERKISWSEHIEEESKTTYEKLLKRQKTYILMDVSASTAAHQRLSLEKAIIFAYLERNEKEYGEVYFRTFTAETGELYKAKSSSEYRHLLNSIIIPAIAEGQTNLQTAILTALSDLNFHSVSESPADLLIVTDGLCHIDVDLVLRKANQLKIHVILIGDDPIYLSSRELDELFAKKRKAEYAYIERTSFSAQAKENKQEYSRSHQKEKEKMQAEIHDDRIKQLELLAQKTNGRFIQINDIRPDKNDFDEVIHSIESELIELEKQLENNKLSPIEIEMLLQEYLALKNYLNALTKREKNQRQRLDSISKRMQDFLESNERLVELMLQSQMSIKYSHDGSNFIDIKLSDLIKILFHKIKFFFLKRSESNFILKR